MNFEQSIFIVLMQGLLDDPSNEARAINGTQIKMMAQNAADIAKTYEELRPKSIIEKGYQKDMSHA